MSLASLLLQTPPGQLSSVYADLLSLSSLSSSHSSPSFEAAAQAALRQHAEEQLLLVEAPAGDRAVVCKETRVEGNRYRHVRGETTFEVDLKSLKTSAPRPLRPNAWAEPLRKALHAQLDAYAQDHFADGAVVVVPLSLGIGRRRAAQPAQKKQKEKEKEALVVVVETTEESGETADEQKETQEEQTDAAEEMCEAEAKEDTPAAAAAAAAEPQASEEEEEEESQDDVDVDSETQGATRFVIHVVGNKYSLSNFWAGRWRATYTFDPAAPAPATLEASHQLLVHYFENGNVQLSVSSSRSLSLGTGNASASSSPASDAENVDALAARIAAALQAEEARFHASVERRVAELGEKAFKALRRNLPVSKQKINWDKVSNYKLSGELAK
ncbi:subunits of heterodimeric actin filament capping protein Capz [Tilletiopsis washingtonensis]|uniref:Subunits of heterodimeric actin filament capping protein Capz n=1 Tax=Tilletiopsis washingtonensis TaxID=58919 RepID=A0A316Z3M6_9BASI|nr:subunits of heterodimeric actin filament capping protein Capz [Tilletiopsis washingtonensis]PWN96199.1 subunits of heterodimeric actin filament capping protein Capz [Tilletiopsis washingtonensis]